MAMNNSLAEVHPELECTFGGERCFGVLANTDFILVSTYEKNGVNPELVLYLYYIRKDDIIKNRKSVFYILSKVVMVWLIGFFCLHAICACR